MAAGKFYKASRGKAKKKTKVQKVSIVNRRPMISYNHRSPVAPKMKCVLKYSDFIGITTVGGGITSYAFLANGLYDPRVAIGGHQPRGFDQIMPLYDHFVVIGSTLTARYSNSNKSTMVGVILSDTDPTGSSLYTDYTETGYEKHALLATDGSGPAVRTLSHSFNNKFLGRSSPLSDPELKGSASADPTEKAYLSVWAGSGQAGTDTTVSIWIDIEYTVIFIEPKNPAQS